MVEQKVNKSFTKVNRLLGVIIFIRRYTQNIKLYKFSKPDKLGFLEVLYFYSLSVDIPPLLRDFKALLKAVYTWFNRVSFWSDLIYYL